MEIHRTGFRANDAYTPYLEMGSPKDLTPAQIQHLNDLTADASRERPKPSRTTPLRHPSTSTIPINSNDIVLITLHPTTKH